MRLAVFFVVLLLLLPAAFAASERFSQSPDAVTGHTVYGRHIEIIDNKKGDGLPTDFAAVAGYFKAALPPVALQRECVVWFNGKNLDHRADPDHRFDGSNDFPSDEDDQDDVARQDHDFDRDVEACPPHIERQRGVTYGSYVAVVEQGDCNPREGRDFRFLGHLDFVDPNGIYHEVQEYSYVCAIGGPGNLVPNPAFPGQGGGLSEALRDLLPEWPFPDGRPCGEIDPFWEEMDPQNGSFGNPEAMVFCNARIQALFTERLWISPVHEAVFDPTIQTLYNFAVQIDTCDGSGCRDGSRDSFDDTSRGSAVHRAPPADAEEIMRGNSYDGDPDSSTFGKHRQNCRHAAVDWKGVRQRPGPGHEDCYPEDHKTAQVDIYAMDEDPTGMFALYSNGLTGQNAYVEGPSTGPSWRL